MLSGRFIYNILEIEKVKVIIIKVIILIPGCGLMKHFFNQCCVGTQSLR